MLKHDGHHDVMSWKGGFMKQCTPEITAGCSCSSISSILEIFMLRICYNLYSHHTVVFVSSLIPPVAKLEEMCKKETTAIIPKPFSFIFLQEKYENNQLCLLSLPS
jgi:hypothetical protein